MRTEKQRAASRANGRRSQGPTTPMGKDRIRHNALQHGLTARLTLWASEDPLQFQAMLSAMLKHFLPKDDVEFLCVEEMAMAKWRLRRVVGLEAATGNQSMATDVPLHPPDLSVRARTIQTLASTEGRGQLLTLLRQQEAAYGRAYQRAYRHLQQLRENAPATWAV